MLQYHTLKKLTFYKILEIYSHILNFEIPKKYFRRNGISHVKGNIYRLIDSKIWPLKADSSVQHFMQQMHNMFI